MGKKKERSSIKKPLYKKWWFWVLVVVLLAGLGGNKDGEKSPTQTEPFVTEPAAEKTTQPTVAITETYTIVGGELGEFGFEVVLNQDSAPDKRYEYKLPAGTYNVTNGSTEYMSQLDIVLPDIIVNSDGVEEQQVVSATLFKEGETKIVTIEDGQVVEIEANETWIFYKIA